MAPLDAPIIEARPTLTFFDLPPELRLLIYNYILDEQFATMQAERFAEMDQGRVPHPILLRTSRQVRFETFQMWFDKIDLEREAAWQQLEALLAKSHRADIH